MVLPSLLLSAGSEENSTVFPQTDKTLAGKFLDYWEQNGSVTRFGYPISEQLQEPSDLDGKIYAVQYFERTVFELHPQNQPPYDVLLQLLGNFRYRELYPNSGGAPNQYENNESGAVTFQQTGKVLGGEFLEYWTQHGGLLQYGYPVSNEFQEISPVDGHSHKVQYFERAEFEYHPENVPPYEVLLTQLGTLSWQSKHEAQNYLAPEFRSEIPDGQYLPLYPEAIIKRIDAEGVTGRVVNYVAQADEYTLKAYYVTVLPKYGWTFLNSFLGNIQEYEWTDPKGVMPWHLRLSLLAVTGNAGRGKSEVQFIYSRYPDANKTPLYPDAQDVTVNNAGQGGPPFPASCSDTVTNTTYHTTASLTEVEAYYKLTLAPYGWELTQGSGSIDSAKGLRFLSDHNVGVRGRGQNLLFTTKRLDLSITAQEQRGAGGLTAITLSLHTCMFDESGE
jgi:hypothetical protein